MEKTVEKEAAAVEKELTAKASKEESKEEGSKAEKRNLAGEGEVALSVKGLKKRFGKKQIIKGVSFETKRGEVFGFLGPNGAGKTTCIKMIVGLLSVDEGSISICGDDLEKNFCRAIAHVGAIVENPESYKYLTGYQNLMQSARMEKGVTKERIDEVVELVGLTGRIHEKVGKYSLGMKQRLGVAQALLHRPQVLILDEPTNGLDPAGIKQLRDIVIKLAHEEQISVFVSSHLMSEMEMMCDRVCVISQGEILKVDSVENLIHMSNNREMICRYRVDDTKKALSVLAGFLEKETITIKDQEERQFTVSTTGGEEALADINACLVNGGVRLFAAAPVEEKHLEEIFLELTGTGEGSQIA